ncbi:MAG: alpha/beta hydrolase [Gemmataceae bacterium]|nr:alpha/beta hydrolase [Gemmataceae bacterium]
MLKHLLLFVCLFSLSFPAFSQDKGEKKKQPVPKAKPTVANLHYGPHERQVLDFYQAESKEPTPVVFYIHGGGWQGGDKSSVGNVAQFLNKGISVAAINYRYVKQGVEMKIEPPVSAPVLDAARALQFVRSKAKEWNIDKKRIGATGGSAGGCSSLWLAFHADLADPKSDDPVARESTRLYCAAVNGPQTSLDPKELREWMPNYGYGAHAFGLPNFQSLFDNREKVLKWIQEYSPIESVTSDDPPVGLYFGKQETPPKLGTNQKDPTHSAILGIGLAMKLKSAGVEYVLVHQDSPNEKYPSSAAFLIAYLKR